MHALAPAIHLHKHSSDLSCAGPNDDFEDHMLCSKMQQAHIHSCMYGRVMCFMYVSCMQGRCTSILLRHELTVMGFETGRRLQPVQNAA